MSHSAPIVRAQDKGARILALPPSLGCFGAGARGPVRRLRGRGDGHEIVCSTGQSRQQQRPRFELATRLLEARPHRPVQQEEEPPGLPVGPRGPSRRAVRRRGATTAPPNLRVVQLSNPPYNRTPVAFFLSSSPRGARTEVLLWC